MVLFILKCIIRVKATNKAKSKQNRRKNQDIETIRIKYF